MEADAEALARLAADRPARHAGVGRGRPSRRGGLGGTPQLPRPGLSRTETTKVLSAAAPSPPPEAVQGPRSRRGPGRRFPPERVASRPRRPRPAGCSTRRAASKCTSRGPARRPRVPARSGGHPPPAADIASVDVEPAALQGFNDFTIRPSSRDPSKPTVRVSPGSRRLRGLPTRAGRPRRPARRLSLQQLHHCGPRYSIVQGLPYDRCADDDGGWALCPACDRQYHDLADRRFHAQPIACPSAARLFVERRRRARRAIGDVSIGAAAALMARGRIVAIKGLGGYHLACDAVNAAAVGLLRAKKFRKEQPFALMARDLDVAKRAVHLSDTAIGARLDRASHRPGAGGAATGRCGARQS